MGPAGNVGNQGGGLSPPKKKSIKPPPKDRSPPTHIDVNNVSLPLKLV